VPGPARPARPAVRGTADRRQSWADAPILAKVSCQSGGRLAGRGEPAGRLLDGAARQAGERRPDRQLPGAGRHPQDQARDHRDAGEPVVRLLLRDLPGSGRHPDAPRGTGRVRARPRGGSATWSRTSTSASRPARRCCCRPTRPPTRPPSPPTSRAGPRARAARRHHPQAARAATTRTATTPNTATRSTTNAGGAPHESSRQRPRRGPARDLARDYLPEPGDQGWRPRRPRHSPGSPRPATRFTVCPAGPARSLPRLRTAG
jgi:hypothetical protein